MSEEVCKGQDCLHFVYPITIFVPNPRKQIHNQKKICGLDYFAQY